MSEEEYEYEPQEHDELAIKVLELIKVEVKAKITETIDTLEHYKKSNMNLHKTNAELKQKIRNFEVDVKKALLEKEREVRREMFGGFTLGDTVFHPAYKYANNTCEQCKGEKKISALIEERVMQVRCPGCDGNGKMDASYYYPKEDTISTLQIEVGERNKFINFYLKRADSKVSRDSVFKTIDECQAYCNDRNKPKVATP